MAEHVKREQDAWQVVCDIPGERVRRFATPTGWLYQVERDLNPDGGVWHPAVFVPRK